MNSGACCAKLLFFRAEPGCVAAYSEYLRTSVEPIDETALAEAALVGHYTVVDEKALQGWTHLRVFLFADEAQRARVKDVFARIAALLRPDPAERLRRKTEGEKLRILVAELDVPLLPPNTTRA